MFKCILPLLLIIATSCKTDKKNMLPIVQPQQILKDLSSFLAYKESHIRLYEDFIAYDTAQNRITKADFLQQFATGKYLPLELESVNDSTCYQLYKFNTADNVDILVSNKYWAEHENHFYSMEGKELPNYKFTDLKGNVYTKENTRGEILVIKCWFINCAPCVKEIPKCNDIEKQYSKRDDVKFLAVSWDTKKELQAFTTKNPFSYSIVADQKAFLQDSLALSGYPTHIVIDKRGKISKINFDIKAMMYAIQKETKQ